ncbi:MAG: hypothetical protein ACJATN_001676 [Neolewinella sp.]|jgi:hypothetical protein
MKVKGHRFCEANVLIGAMSFPCTRVSAPLQTQLFVLYSLFSN